MFRNFIVFLFIDYKFVILLLLVLSGSSDVFLSGQLLFNVLLFTGISVQFSLHSHKDIQVHPVLRLFCLEFQSFFFVF